MESTTQSNKLPSEEVKKEEKKHVPVYVREEVNKMLDYMEVHYKLAEKYSGEDKEALLKQFERYKKAAVDAIMNRDHTSILKMDFTKNQYNFSLR